MSSDAADGVSVIICYHNSAARLPETLKHIALQKVPPHIPWEVILIDNNSADGTSAVAWKEWQKYQISVPFKIVTEPKPGLIYARERGFTEAQFGLLLFCDDDNWLQENYIRHAVEIMDANSNVAILGSQSTAFFETEKPSWFNDFEKAYVVGKPMQQSGIANARSYIAGAGMVIRKAVLQLLYSLNFKPLLTGRKGKELLSGEDSEISLLVIFLGYDLYYDERLQFTHFIPAGRLSWSYCVSMIASGHAIPQVYFDFYRYCFGKILDAEKPAFENVYPVIRKRTVNRTIRALSPLWVSFKAIIQSKPGSKKAIEIKAAFNKLRFILFNKKKLQQEFEIICSLLRRIKEHTNECKNQ